MLGGVAVGVGTPCLIDVTASDTRTSRTKGKSTTCTLYYQDLNIV